MYNSVKVPIQYLENQIYHNVHPPMGPGNTPVMQKNLFVRILVTDIKPFTLNLQGIINGYVRELILYQYSIKGVPVSNGSPDHSYYDLEIKHGTESMNWIRHDGKHAAALVLTGTDTTINLSVPIHIAEPNIHKHSGVYTIELKHPDGTPAFFSECNLWFTIKF